MTDNEKYKKYDAIMTFAIENLIYESKIRKNKNITLKHINPLNANDMFICRCGRIAADHLGVSLEYCGPSILEKFFDRKKCHFDNKNNIDEFAIDVRQFGTEIECAIIGDIKLKDIYNEYMR